VDKQKADAGAKGGLYSLCARLLFPPLRIGEISTRSGEARMLRLIRFICAAALILLIAPGCTWTYYVAQAWQRGSCTRLVEQTERERCLSNTNMSYEDYRRHIEGAKKD